MMQEPSPESALLDECPGDPDADFRAGVEDLRAAVLAIGLEMIGMKQQLAAISLLLAPVVIDVEETARVH